MGNSSKQKPSLDRMLAAFDSELANFESLVHPAPESKPRTPFDSPHLSFDQMYMSRFSLHQILSFLPVIIPLRIQMGKSARFYDGKFRPAGSETTQEFYLALEKLARLSGAADIRYVHVPRNAIFQHKGIPYEY